MQDQQCSTVDKEEGSTKTEKVCSSVEEVQKLLGEATFVMVPAPDFKQVQPNLELSLYLVYQPPSLMLYRINVAALPF